MTITDIITRLEKCEAPDRDIDEEIAVTLLGMQKINLFANLPKAKPIWEFYDPESNSRGAASVMIPSFTGSVDAAIALCERVLPGWGYCLGTCWVSDDARVFPDYNSPTHGERLKERFAVKVGAEREKWTEEVEWVDFTDVALSPPRGLAIALCLSILIALRKIEELEAISVPAV